MGDGHVQPFLGGYSAYLEARRQAEAQSQGSGPAKPATPREKTKTKFSYHEQREYDTIEQEIETLELTLDEIKTQMAQAGSDYVALQRLTEEQQTLETKIEQRWTGGRSWRRWPSACGRREATMDKQAYLILQNGMIFAGTRLGAGGRDCRGGRVYHGE